MAEDTAAFTFRLRDRVAADDAPADVTVNNVAGGLAGAKWVLLQWLLQHCGVSVEALVDPSVVYAAAGAGAPAPTLDARARLTNLFSRYEHVTEAPTEHAAKSGGGAAESKTG